MHQPKALQRIIDVYFRESARTQAVSTGTQVLQQMVITIAYIG